MSWALLAQKHFAVTNDPLAIDQLPTSRTDPLAERMEHFPAPGVRSLDELRLDDWQRHFSEHQQHSSLVVESVVCGSCITAVAAGRVASMRASILGSANRLSFSRYSTLYEHVGMFVPSTSGTPTQHFMTRETSK